MKFALGIARRIRSTALARGDKWHLDEVVVTYLQRRLAGVPAETLAGERLAARRRRAAAHGRGCAES